jgi:hypothetical protein
MGRFVNSMSVAATGLALGAFFSAPVAASAQSPDVQAKTITVAFGAGVDVAVSKDAKPVLLSKESSDVDGDGKADTVSYFDMDKDGSVDSEVIDLGSTGKPSIVALRCDADKDGKFDDWLVVDAETEQARAALIDGNDDGDVDRVAFADGSGEPVEDGANDLFRPVSNN